MKRLFNFSLILLTICFYMNSHAQDEVEFDASNLSSGIYFNRIKATPNGGPAGNFVETKKMILM